MKIFQGYAALLAKIAQLRRELHDERGRLIAGTEVERLQTELA